MVPKHTYSRNKYTQTYMVHTIILGASSQQHMYMVHKHTYSRSNYTIPYIVWYALYDLQFCIQKKNIIMKMSLNTNTLYIMFNQHKTNDISTG